MTWIRRNIFKVLMITALLALPGADIECEDDEFEFNWPSFDFDDDCDDFDDCGYWGPPVFYEPAPCCWFW